MSIELSIVGYHAVEAALYSPFVRVKKLDVTEHALAQLQQKRSVPSIPWQIRPLSFFKSDQKHQGIAAQISLESFGDLRELESWQDFKTLLILDHLQDPQNLGSALRHALAFHVDAVIIPKHKAAPLTAAVAHASSGCLFKLPIIQVSSFLDVLKQIKSYGFGLIGTSVQSTAKLLSPEVFWDKSALVIGSEGSGSSPHVLSLCDTIAHIPIAPACESLNAAVCAAIMCYERAKLLPQK